MPSIFYNLSKGECREPKHLSRPTHSNTPNPHRNTAVRYGNTSNYATRFLLHPSQAMIDCRFMKTGCYVDSSLFKSDAAMTVHIQATECYRKRRLPHTRLNIVTVEICAVTKGRQIGKCEDRQCFRTDMNIFRGKHPVACNVTFTRVCVRARACVCVCNVFIVYTFFTSASVLQKMINITAENFRQSSGQQYVYTQIYKQWNIE